MLALLAALKEEISDLRKGIALKESYTWQNYLIYDGEYNGKSVLLAQTGMGKERAEAATEFILQRYPVTALVSFGFAGAVNENLQIGDVVICSTLYSSNDVTKGNPCSSDASLISLSLQVLPGKITRLSQGKSVTVAQPASTPEVKSDLCRTFNADIVDMESYWIGKIASAREVPFLAVRAISDTLQDNLLPFDRFMDMNGKLLRQKAILYFLSHPQHVAKLFALQRNAWRARKNLTAFIDYLIGKL